MFSEFFYPVMHATILAAGLLIPFGMQNMFIFNQGAAQSSFTGALPSIITASICDTVLIILAVFGVSLILMENVLIKNVIFFAGSIFLFYMGFSLWSQPANKIENRELLALSPKKQILFSASVSIFNPHAIIDTVAVIGTNAVRYSSYSKMIYMMTCILISWIWFFSLSILGNKVNQLDKTGNVMYYMNKVAALIMWCLGFYLFVQLS